MMRGDVKRMLAPAALACMAACGAAQGPGAPAPAGAAAPVGAAPPVVSDTATVAKLKALLAPYRPDTLTARDARAIRRALHEAGLQRGPALDKAMADLGFSSKRLESLDPEPPPLPLQPPHSPQDAASGTARKVPRPE